MNSLPGGARPSFTEGFRADPMAHEGVFERIASFDRVLSPGGSGPRWLRMVVKLIRVDNMN